MGTGLFRLWLVLSVIWVGVWAKQVHDDYRAIHLVQGLVHQYVPKKPTGFLDTIMAGFGSSTLQLLDQNLNEQITYMVCGPIALAALFMATAWIISGFRRGREDQPDYREMRKEPELSLRDFKP